MLILLHLHHFDKYGGGLSGGQVGGHALLFQSHDVAYILAREVPNIKHPIFRSSICSTDRAKPLLHHMANEDDPDGPCTMTTIAFV